MVWNPNGFYISRSGGRRIAAVVGNQPGLERAGLTKF